MCIHVSYIRIHVHIHTHTHTPTPFKQVKCSFALAKLCWQHEPNRRRLIGLRAALVVTRVLNQHPTDLPVRVCLLFFSIMCVLPVSCLCLVVCVGAINRRLLTDLSVRLLY